MRSFISAILLHGDIIFDTIRFRARFVGSLRTHSHIQDQENVGDQFVKGIERTGHRAVCILITLPDIFNIPRMDAVNWIHLFPFLKIRLRAGTRFSDISRGYAFACSSSPSSSVIILRNFNPPLRYRVRSLSGSIPDRLRRYENRTRSRTRLLSSNICSYCSNCFLSRNDLIIVDSPLAASPF